MYSFHVSLIPFSSTITLPDTPFRQFDPVTSCLSFTICFAIRKISFCWLGSFRSLAHSLCFFPFANEISFLCFVYSSRTPPMPLLIFAFSNLHTFLADRTIGRAFGTMCRLSVCRLSVCDVLYCGKMVHPSEKVSEEVNRKPGSKS